MRAAHRPWILALALAGCRAPQPAQPQRADPPAETGGAREPQASAEVALAALEQASLALASWREEVAQGERLDDGALLELRGATQALEHELQALMERVQERDAAVRPDPQQTARNELLSMQAREVARPWIDDVRGLGEGAAERRAAALEAVRSALAVQHPAPTREQQVGQLAALMTLQQAGDVEYDKTAFRPLVLPLAQEARGQLMVSALFALQATDPRPGDLELVYAAWERDREALGNWTLHLLKGYGGGRLEGRSEQIALECLADVDGRRVNQQLNGLWGAVVGPRLEARVLELARSSDRELRHGAIYFGLSTFADKSEAVVDALIDTLADPDPNNWDRALWGLGHGVPEALQPGVAAALVELHDARSDPRVRARCAELVQRYGGAEAAERLER